jgi:hypothetical protein
MKVRKPPQSGSLGNVVAKRNRFGQYESKKPSTAYNHTPARRRSCRTMTRVSQLWNEITEEQRDAWWRRAGEVRSQPRLGISGWLTGQNLIVKINTVRETCGQPLLLDPPPLPHFTSNCVEALKVVQGRKGPLLKLRLSARPTQEIMVFASPPRNPGRRFCEAYAFIGLLPNPVESESDITRLYMKKYGVPPAGSRIFIRTLPVENGWEGKGWMRLTRGDVPLGRKA